MKKIILTAICLIFILINKSYASNDSLVTHNDTLKETNPPVRFCKPYFTTYKHL